MLLPKPTRTRDEGYLKWLRTKPCAACGRPWSSEASHHDEQGHGGMGTKADDVSTLPLCHRCHVFWHRTYRIFGLDHLSREQTDEWIQRKAARYRREFEREQRRQR